MKPKNLAKNTAYHATIDLPVYTRGDLLGFADETDKLKDIELISWAEVRGRVHQKYGISA